MALNDTLDSELNLVKEESKFAGFWARFSASLLDLLVLAPLIGLNVLNLYLIQNIWMLVILTLLLFLYKPIMEYKYSATIGKMASGFKVLNIDRSPITLKQSVIRYLPWFLTSVFSIYSTIFLYLNPQLLSATYYEEVELIQNGLLPYQTVINFILIFFWLASSLIVTNTDDKRGIHDFMAHTYCIYNTK